MSRHIGHQPTDSDYQRLLGFRTGLRRFLRWSGDQAAGVGLTPAQHQLLLAVRGHPGPGNPSIGDVAEYLLERQHSVSGLVDRAVHAGLVRRTIDPDDRRVVRLELTAKGSRKLEQLTALTLEELERFGPKLQSVWAGLEETR